MRTPITYAIAAEDLLWARKDGSEIQVQIRIGNPYQVGTSEWACPVELMGIDGQYLDVHGESSLQSLCFALNLVRTRLGHHLEDGETLLDSKDRSPWGLESLTSTFGRP